MRNIEYGIDTLHEKRTEKRDIAYTADFKKWVEEHEGAMSAAVFLIEDIESKLANLDKRSQAYQQLNKAFWDGVSFPDHDILERVFDKDGVKVSLKVFKGSHIYKVVVGEDAFFVKREDRTRSDGVMSGKVGGYVEVKSSASAKDLLKNIEGVEVIDFKLGYENKKEKVRYFVSRWEPDFKKISEDDTFESIEKQEKDRLRLLMDQIRNILGSSFIEIAEHNMFYDKKRKKIIIYDLNSLEYVAQE